MIYFVTNLCVCPYNEHVMKHPIDMVLHRYLFAIFVSGNKI